ncbi:conserved Plasmodium protein, unknown function [Plasmodium ovale wallikeri]|uniref:Uncharacterized protein n=1 Tax=Plasmodium ovale wallikeri TaxID=864142 RepID=A0A1A8ZZD6_PLAOA|nr:conserved Plasmodium protein, unknown function [Plasmodium ovale wallikeri]
MDKFEIYTPAYVSSIVPSLQNTSGISNFLIGQELIIDKLLFEKKYLNNKRKNKVKNVKKLNYYLNDKFHLFLGYDHFINTIFKKKKILPCDLTDVKEKKKKKGCRGEEVFNVKNKAEGEKKSLGDDKKREDTSSRLKSENNDINDFKLKRENSGKKSNNSNNETVIFCKKKNGIDKTSDDEDTQLDAKGNYRRVKQDGTKKDGFIDRDWKDMSNNEKKNISLDQPDSCNDLLFCEKEKEKCKVVNEMVDTSMKEKTSDLCDNQYGSKSKREEKDANYVNTLNLKECTDSNQYFYSLESVISFSSSSSCSEASDVSNISPDVLCFEKQFKYIYDMYRQNDKNVFLFYNPPMCKCTNKVLKERYFRCSNIKYPCLFNCSFSRDNIDTKVCAPRPADGNAGHNVGGSAGHNVGGSADHNVGGNAGHNVGGSADHNVGGSADHNIGGSADHNADGNADHNADHNADGNADHNADGNVDGNTNVVSKRGSCSSGGAGRCGEVASDAVEMKLYAKAFFELYFFERGFEIGNDLKQKAHGKVLRECREEKWEEFPEREKQGEVEKMLKAYFEKCLYKILKNKSKTCENSACCGLLYVPYSYIVVLLNRRVENLTYVCTYLNLPSNTDIYYNNKKNVITICTRNAEHEFFIYYSLKQNKYVKSILIYDVCFDGFIPFFKPLLNLKIKKNQEKILSYVNYNKNVNLSIVFFLTEKAGSPDGYGDSGDSLNGGEIAAGCAADSAANSAANSANARIAQDLAAEKAAEGSVRSMKLRICKIFNINHRNELKHAIGNKSNAQKKYTHLKNEKEEDDIENYFSNICSGREVINNMNIKMIVGKIMHILNKKDNVCNEKCIYNEYNKCIMKNKDIHVYLCESLNCFAFDRRPLCIKKRDIVLSPYVHFHNLLNNYHFDKDTKKLHDVIKSQINRDVFKNGIMTSLEKGKHFNNDEKLLLQSTEEDKNRNKYTDSIFNESFFIFNDNSDLYTYEEYKKSRIDNISKSNEKIISNRILKNTIDISNGKMWDMLCSQYLQGLFNIYVCSYILRQNDCSIMNTLKKKKKSLNLIPHEHKQRIIKRYYYYLFNIYKTKFNICLTKDEEEAIHQNIWRH